MGKVLGRSMSFRCRAGLHQEFAIDEGHGTVHCADCNEVVDPFHALLQVSRAESSLEQYVQGLRKEAEELKKWTPISKAMKEIDRRWRGNKAIPSCPHCGVGIFRDEVHSFVGVEFEKARRRKKQ